jgi:adenylate cyclase
MRLSRRARRAFRMLGIHVALSMVGGGLVGMLLGLITIGAAPPQAFLRGAVVVGLAASLIFSFELFVLEHPRLRRVRRQPFLVLVTVKSFVYLAAFAVSLALGERLVPIPGVEPYRLQLSSLRYVVFALALGFAFNVALFVTRLLGQGVLWSFVTGKYHRPRREERIFLLLDLVDSTRIAERIGNLRFQQFLNDVFFDITPALVEHRGEIYKYVGDEVIVSWSMSSSASANGDCVSAALAAQAALARRRAHYDARYGLFPELRAALHAGEVVSGEIGDVRREIGFLGDVLNTLSRIEEFGKRHGVPAVCSGTLLQRIDLPAGVSARSLGHVALRGKEATIELYALS